MRIIGILIFILISKPSFGQAKTIHVFVALCDNINQGIVPVPKSIGNGQDPKNNLYWGAGYGVKTFFKVKTRDWTLLRSIPSKDSNILERLLFKHATKDIYLLADAYDGAKIKTSIEDFLKSSNGQIPIQIKEKERILDFGGGSDLLAYVGHDGLMDFDVNITYKESVTKTRDVIILACYSKSYFSPEIKKAKANPILWTTHLMAPEAYTLKAAIDGWVRKESGSQIDERAAQSYHKYQKCGIRGARNLFTTGF
ncbi:hypothetical protein D1818_22020 [Aquimarina sp. BL5]|uniref:hypothetical protein n=1 Tax=Aquimarina sp. BL5 TaxID=1714860 RepID=UPI000E493627|nr:hypothetical protein [Aquimarina sp. BL5]AXT53373.1 hypothetical protein D1818_22020 [Aquimarina sp. BL5]RKM91112.1 hypothetical protein D7036_23620 [Aquimarina sp. BL5]